MGLSCNLEHWLSIEWWEVHEAAFILTEWPKNMIVAGLPEFIHKQFNRGVIYFPEGRLLKKTVNKNTLKVLIAMIHAIQNGELPAESRNLFLSKIYGKNVSYLVRSFDVIFWYLLAGFILPDELQKKLNIYQLKNLKLPKKPDKTVKNQIVGQHLLAANPQLCRNLLLKNTLFNRFGTGNESEDKELKAIRRDLNQLFPVEKRVGRQPKDQIPPYVPKAIPQVVQRSDDGQPHYHLPLLKTAITTSAKIKIDSIERQQLNKMTEEEFLDDFFCNEVVRLYIDQAPPNVMKMVRMFCLQELTTMYSHPKINLLANEYRSKLTIGQLWELNKELVFAPFTPEERRVIDKLDKAKSLGLEVELTEEEKMIFKPRRIS